MRNITWELVDLPSKKKFIGCKWIFKIKYKENGNIDKHKVQVKVESYAQRERNDYEETFVITAMIETIKTDLAMPIQFSWQLQIDCKSVFLNADLKENIYTT